MKKALAAQTRCSGFNFFFFVFSFSPHTIKYALYITNFINKYSIHHLDIDDLFDVQSELNPIAANWKNIGLALRLKPDLLETIEAAKTGNPPACLSVTIKEWLKRNYNVRKFGEPSWQHLVEAVNHPAGGANVALATKIAKNHKAKGMYVLVSPCCHCYSRL